MKTSGENIKDTGWAKVMGWFLVAAQFALPIPTALAHGEADPAACKHEVRPLGLAQLPGRQALKALRLRNLNLLEATLGEEGLSALQAEPGEGDKQLGVPRKREFEIGMRVLLLSAESDAAKDPGIALGVRVLRAYGIPFDHIALKDASGKLRAGPLPLYNALGGPRYYGIVTTTGELGHQDESGNFSSALDEGQWDELRNYERTFNVRRVSLFSYPNSTMGLALAGGNSDRPQKLQVSALARQMDAALKADAPIELANSWHYKAEIKDERLARPFLTYEVTGTGIGIGDVAAAALKYPDGREQLHFFFSQVPWAKASTALAGTWLHWLTRGTYIGQRRLYLNVHVDDFFLATNLWDPDANRATSGGRTHRLSPEDFRHFTEWQAREFRRLAQYPDYRVELAYNGAGPGIYKDKAGVDRLFELSKSVFPEYTWLSHTFTHADLNTTTREETDSELQRNIDFIEALFKEYPIYRQYHSHESMVTPRISGLLRELSLRSLYDHGIRYVTGDNTRSELAPAHPYTARWTTREQNGLDGILIIPRFATEIYYDASVPTELVAEYNYHYADKKGVSTFEEILEREAARVVPQLMTFDPAPYMFHQSNMNVFEYKGRRVSLLSLWMEGVAKEVRKTSNLPMLSLKMDDLKNVYLERMAYDRCGVEPVALYRDGILQKVRIQARGQCKVPITGIAPKRPGVDVQKYGPDYTVTIQARPIGEVEINAR